MPDFQVTDHGSIVTVLPLNDLAVQWLGDNVEAEGWQWLHGALCVDRRCAGPLIEGIMADGMNVSL